MRRPRARRDRAGMLAHPERLEARDMKAVVTCTIDKGEVTIRTDNASTNVNFDARYGDSGYAVTVTDSSANRSWNFSSWDTLRVDFQGGKGNDSFSVTSDSIAFVFVKADGGPGNDTLRGGEGNDVLSGGEGNDTLFGNGGDDQLYGNGGNDVLFGGDGSDSLYGGVGKDNLDGGAGNDGLFGGIGERDRVRGGEGADRFMTMSTDVKLTERVFVKREKYYKSVWHRIKGKPSHRDVYKNVTRLVPSLEDDVVDRAPASGVPATQADVVVHLRNPAKNYGPQGERFQPGRWTDADVLPLDEAFALLVHSTNNNRLLTRSNGTDPIYLRYGKHLSGPGQVAAWNSGDAISLPNVAFSVGKPVETIFHEIGHYWHGQAANFDAISGWRTTPAAGFTRSLDKSWYYRNGSTFAYDYGKTNPDEDYATAFEAYFSWYAGFPYDHETLYAIEAKINNVSAFVNSLRT